MSKVRSALQPHERIYFYVPGYKPNYIEYSMTFVPMNIIFCLEDGTPETHKLEARYLVKHALREHHDSEHTLVVRINSVYTDHWQRDLDQIVVEGPKRIRVPMVNKAEDLHKVDLYIQEVLKRHDLQHEIQYEVMIESREGLANMQFILQATDKIYAFTFGGTDYAEDCVGHIDDVNSEVMRAKEQLGRFCKEHGVHCFDTTYMDYRNLDGFRQDCEASSLYFSGRSVIHPDQVRFAKEIYGSQN